MSEETTETKAKKIYLEAMAAGEKTPSIAAVKEMIGGGTDVIARARKEAMAEHDELQATADRGEVPGKLAEALKAMWVDARALAQSEHEKAKQAFDEAIAKAESEAAERIQAAEDARDAAIEKATEDVKVADAKAAEAVEERDRAREIVESITATLQESHQVELERLRVELESAREEAAKARDDAAELRGELRAAKVHEGVEGE